MEERGFVLTGDNAFIESYKRATANFYTFHGHLSVLVADSPAQLRAARGDSPWLGKLDRQMCGPRYRNETRRSDPGRRQQQSERAADGERAAGHG